MNRQRTTAGQNPSEWARVPALDIDQQLGQPHARGKLERRIFANLVAHLDRAGFVLSSIWDGEERTAVTTVKSAMELAFNLDECSVRFVQRGQPVGEVEETGNRFGANEHGVLLVFGNGVDCVSDWNYTKGDPDGWNKAMEAFDAEHYA